MDATEFINLVHSYEGISTILKTCSHQEIVSIVSELVSVDEKTLEGFPVGNAKDQTGGAYCFVLEDLLRNVKHYDWLYGKLADDRSKSVMILLLQYRLIPDITFVKQAYDGANRPYFDKAIVTCDENEVFVDCGGMTGETAEDYIRQYEKYGKIYVYEPSNVPIQACRKNLKKYRNVVVRKQCVGEKSVWPSMESEKGVHLLTETDRGEAVETVSLDEEIRETVTFIKMNIGGAETSAIIGAKNHIQNDSPKLAVSIYHRTSDMWEIPKLIDSINPDYEFYLRHYVETKNCGTVLYAVPKKRKPTDLKAHTRKIVAMAPYDRGWSNVELVKDCGLIPYIMHKKYGYEVSMVGAEGGPYPYHEQYTKGVTMEFLPNGQVLEKLRYLEAHAKEIDGLLLRGCYPTNFPVAKTYKRLNPRGRIYVGLDANSGWMDRILWDDKEFMEFMDCCDVIATSCSAMQKHLNEKWPWKIEHIPNGWYDFTSLQKPPVYEEKENTILTVGRLGTQQKATEVLLEAFARIAQKVPDWKLRLVGNVEAGFEAYRKAYFERFPQLAGRVQFVGAIADRELLYSEYRRAKIFALPSEMEGGTPNVIAEALYGGCVTAVSKFDAYEEATDFGRCGLSAEIRDVDGFAGILLNLCRNKNLKQLSGHACQYAGIHFDMEKIVARVDEMLFGEV